MRWRKNVFSYLFWIVYTLFTGTAVFWLVGELVPGSLAGTYVGTAVVFAAAGLLVFLLHRFGPKYSADSPDRNTVRSVSEAAAAVVLLAIGLVLRVRAIGGAGQLNAYYEMAQVSAEGGIPQLAHGAAYFYVQLLHLVFYFLGNKFIAGIWLQIILQLGACLVLYLGLRKLSGHLAALISLGFMMCSPVIIGKSLLLSPEMLYLLLSGLVLWGIVSGKKSGLSPVGAFAAGLFAGAVSYLDVTGVLLVLLAALAAFTIRGGRISPGRRLCAFLCSILGTAAGFLGCIGADALSSGKEFNGVLSAWLYLYQPKEGGFNPALTEIPVTFAEAAVLAVLFSLGVFGFWCSKHRDCLGICTLLASLTAAAAGFGIFTEEMPGELPLYLFCIFLAGIGIEECFRKDDRIREPVVEAVETSETSASVTEDVGETKNKPPKETTGENGTGSAATKAAEKTSAQKLPKSSYIENPLPLPPKHKKRVLDYDFALENGKENFDVAVSEEDDFDIT